MNLRQVARLLAGFTLFFAASLAVPLAHAQFDASPPYVSVAFGVALSVGFGLALLLWIYGRGASTDMFRREGLAVVGIAWLIAGVLAAIPYQASGVIPSPVDAVFESISGLTTTGATVLGTGNIQIESVPKSILLWRAMTHWMGGIGVILVFIVLLPGMGVTGSRLLISEQVGVSSGGDQPRMLEQARRLFFMYLMLSVLAALGYWLTGMNPFDAVCHSFATLATGGFSTQNASVGQYQNLGVELVAIVFMFLAGCNFLLLVRCCFDRGRGRTVNWIQRVEVQVYAGVVLSVAAAITLILWLWGEPLADDAVGMTHDYGNLGRCARDALFQTTSILTSTGFATADFERWPKPALYLLIFCMFIGASSGSTAGGFKIVRMVVCTKLVIYSMRQFIQPRRIEKLRVGAEVIPARIVSSILAILLLWLGIVGAGTLLLDLDPRLDLVSAFTASLSMMSCVGPSISEVMPLGDGTYALVGGIDLGPYSGYGELQPFTKLFMALQMVLGRLEIVAPIVLLTPAFWKKS